MRRSYSTSPMIATKDRQVFRNKYVVWGAAIVMAVRLSCLWILIALYSSRRFNGFLPLELVTYPDMWVYQMTLMGNYVRSFGPWAVIAFVTVMVGSTSAIFGGLVGLFLSGGRYSRPKRRRSHRAIP
jgi:hypothetical protein